MKQDLFENRPRPIDGEAVDREEIAEAARFPAENPNPVFRVASDGHLLYANRASGALLRHWGVVGQGCVPGLWRDRISDVLAANEARKWDVQINERMLQLHCVPIAAGGYVNVYGADGTERAIALENLRASEARYHTLFDSVDEGFCVIEVLFDENGKPVDYAFLEANPAFECQASLINPIGRRVRSMLPLHEEHWFQTYGKIALTGEPARFEHDAAQLGRYYDVYAFRVGNPAERTVAVLFNDISAGKQAEAERDRLWREVEARNRELEAQAEQIRALNASLEERVLERTAELEAIFASVPDALYVSDENRVLRCNQTTLDAFGCESLDELNEKRRELVSQMQPRYASTGQPIPSAEIERIPALRSQRGEVEMTIRHRPTQRDRTYRVAAAPVELNGQIVAAVAVATDITEQKRNELELAYQANLLANVSDAVISTDLEHRVTSLNRAAEELFGWSQAEAHGRPITEVLPSRFVRTSIEEVYRQLTDDGHWRGEMVVTCRDGRSIHVEATGMPVRDASGQVIGHVGVNRDMTAQRQARAQIDYLASLLDNVNDAVFAYDVDLRITAWNKRAEEQYGWNAVEALGAFVPDIVGSRVTADQRDAVTRELTDTGRWQGEIMHTRRDGTPIIVEATVMRLCDETGRVTGFVAVSRDITERKKAEDEIRASREQLQALSRRLVTMQEAERSYVADQLYNQAGQVLAALHMQLSRFGKDGWRDASGTLVPMMETTVKEAMRELHELAVQLRPVGLDRSTLAGVLGRYVVEFCGTHGLIAEYDPGNTETLRVPADVATAVYRCVQEGLTNVARHAHASQVDLSLSRERGGLTVTLADNGVGFQVESGRSANGLGLASIRERLEILGGKLTIESGASGTTLIVQVPLLH